MALASFIGQVAVGTSTGSLAVTGVGFQPKVVLFWMVAQTGTGQGASYQVGFGAATSSTARFAVEANANSGAATTVCRNELWNSRCIALHSADGATVAFAADFTSLDSDGFTLNRVTAGAASYILNYLCLGGTDLVNVAVGTQAMPIATGNFSLTGLAFQPNAALFGCPGTTGTTANAQNNHRGLSVGWALSSTSRAMAVFGGQNGVVLGTTTEGTLVSTTKCLGSLNASASTLETAADFVSFTADGYTLNKTTGGSATLYGYIALSVTAAAAGTTTAQTSTGNFSVSGAGMTPAVALFLLNGGATATQAAPSADVTWSFGAAVSSTQRGSVWIGDKNGIGTADAPEQRQDSTRCLMRYDPASPFSIIGDLDCVSLNSDGFTLNQTDADSAATLVPYLLLGTAGGGTTTLKSATDSATLVETASLQTSDQKTATDSATLVDTPHINAQVIGRDLGSVVDFATSLTVIDPLVPEATVSETAQIVATLATQVDAFSLSETAAVSVNATFVTASDAFGVTDVAGALTGTLTGRDALALAERGSVLTVGGLTVSAGDTFALTETAIITILSQRYALGSLTLGPRLQGSETLTPRLGGELDMHP